MQDNPFAAAAAGVFLVTEPRHLRLDIAVDQLGPSYQASLDRAADQGLLTMVIHDGQRFMSSDEMVDYLAAGTCLWDEHSAAYIPPRAWLDEPRMHLTRPWFAA